MFATLNCCRSDWPSNNKPFTIEIWRFGYSILVDVCNARAGHISARKSQPFPLPSSPSLSTPASRPASCGAGYRSTQGPCRPPPSQPTPLAPSPSISTSSNISNGARQQTTDATHECHHLRPEPAPQVLEERRSLVPRFVTLLPPVKPQVAICASGMVI